MKQLSFPLGLDWFNSPPLSWERHLLGKVVLLDFWTFCCINCMHTLPDIAYLLSKYKGEAVACIGVHSAKFPNERVGAHVREAMMRYGVDHPVVNDPEMILWKEIGVRAWPTLALFDPSGGLVELFSGEGNRDAIDQKIYRLLDEWPELDNAPLPSTPERREDSTLRYPSKLVHHPTEELLFVSDSGHHQIVIATPDGDEVERIGSGAAGWSDGPFSEARFHSPQGLAYRSGKIYLADTENHLLRCIDLQERQVTTLAGTGKKGSDHQGGREGKEQALNSPWDLIIVGHCIYIAMAGLHQIWLYDLLTGRASAYSGSGAELHLNSNHPQRASWAQPSGITYGDGLLYIADSESSAIRSLDPTTHETKTIAGGDPMQPQNLFAFGDREGVGSKARFQHPLGLTWWEQKRRIIVADSYNHKVKLVNPQTGEVKEWLDGFSEPAGVALSPDGKSLFIADTNNCSIRVEKL